MYGFMYSREWVVSLRACTHYKNMLLFQTSLTFELQHTYCTYNQCTHAFMYACMDVCMHLVLLIDSNVDRQAGIVSEGRHVYITEKVARYAVHVLYTCPFTACLLQHTMKQLSQLISQRKRRDTSLISLQACWFVFATARIVLELFQVR